MTIFISVLSGNMIGGGLRHLTNFLLELGKQDQNKEYIVLVGESCPKLTLPNNIRLEKISDRVIRNRESRLYYYMQLLPRRLKQESAEAVVSLGNFGPIWSPVPHILFQRNATFYCHYYIANIRGKEKIETYLQRHLAVASMKRADLIVTPSHAMADMIRETFPEISNRRFYTLYHGCSKESLSEPLDQKYVKMLGVEGVKLLYPTHLAKYKGFDILFNILSYLKKQGMKFKLFTTISCYDYWPDGYNEYEQSVQKLGLKNDVVFMGRIPQQQMGSIYQQCDLMVYPSLCESFGFSMIEALVNGLPIVAADTAVNREICGKGAYYYPPLDYATGAGIIMKAPKPDNLRTIIDEGKKQLLSYDWSWQRYAKEFVKMIGSVL